MEYYDAAGQWLGGSYPSGQLGTFRWTQFKAEAKLPTQARRMIVGLYLRQGTTGTAWFDNVEVHEAVTLPLRLFVKVPNYRGLIQRGDAKPWKADLVVNHGVNGNSLQVRSQVLDNGTVVASRTVAVPPRIASESNTAFLTLAQPPGSVVLRQGAKPRWRIELLDANGSTIDTQERIFQVVEVMPRVYIARGGTWMVNGEPFYPLGIYLGPQSDTSDENLALIAAAGFNTVLCYGYGAGQEPRQFLDRAHKHGLRVIYSLKDFYEFNWQFPRELGKSGAQLTREYVTLLRDHPALLAWYLNDETGLDKEPDLSAMYNTVAALDPEHPALHVLYQYDQLDGYYDLTDVLGVDPYPVPKFPFNIVPRYVDAARKASRGAKSPLAVTQAFSQEVYPSSGNKLVRYPTLDELRCMNLLALISGAKGIFFYSFMDLWMKDAQRTGERDEAKFAREWVKVSTVLKQLTTLLPALKDSQRQTLTVQNSGSAAVKWRALRYANRVYLIVASPDAARTATLVLSDGAWKGVKQSFGNLKVSRNTQGVTVQVPAHGSGVVALEP